MATAPATSAPRSAQRDATTQPDAERSSLKKPAPVTWGSLPHKGQLAILALVRVVDFFQMASLQAYMFYQLKSFAPGLPDSTISFQAGVLQGIFTSAQIATSIIWGRVADAPWAGRKFVLLVGLIGTGLSCVGVGYSKSFTTAAVFRMLGGASNGTVGAARTALAETVNKKYHPRAFLLLPLAFNIANILGPSASCLSPLQHACADGQSSSRWTSGGSGGSISWPSWAELSSQRFQRRSSSNSIPVCAAKSSQCHSPFPRSCNRVVGSPRDTRKSEIFARSRVGSCRHHSILVS
jgi:MFS family permease